MRGARFVAAAVVTVQAALGLSACGGSSVDAIDYAVDGTLPTYNTTLTLARMQRVASVMERLKQLPANFPVSSMFYPPAGSEG